METGDAAMTDVFSENQPTMTSGIDSLKQCLEQHLAEINLSISRGMSEIKTDLEARMQTCHKSQMPRQDMRTNTFGGVGVVMTLISHFRSVRKTAELGEVEVRQWSKRCNSLEGRIHQLEQEKEQLRQVHEEHMAMEINIANDTRGLQQQLATANERNQELQDQVTKFRDIILKKVSDQPQATPDSTIIGTFVDLRVKIQHIVLKFCQCNLQPRHIKSSSLPEQREFFAIWNTGLSIHQLQNRARGKIFELLGQNILCAAIFGLDDVDKSGRLEAELAQFEVYLNSIRRGHEADISDWRTQTLKCASFCQGPPSQQPQRVAQHIIDFMTPVLPRREKAEEKYVEPCNHTLQLCTTAFKLTLLLRGCKDLYRCEIPVRGGEFVEEEADEQDSEAVSGKGPPRAKKIAFAMSGTLVKYTEHKDRIVLEKAHIVTTD